MERVLGDLLDADGVVDEAPAFVVIYGGQGRRLSSSRLAGEFVAILEEQVELAVAGSS